MKSINPATEELIEEYPETTDSQLDERLTLSDKAQREWSGAVFSKRSVLMNRLAETLRLEKSSASRLMTMEMGKPIREAESEIDKCAWVCEFYAENAERFLSPRVINGVSERSYVRHDPLGTILAIMPWNFPFWQVFRFAVPALMAGNAVLLKHASNVSGVALKIEGWFKALDFPNGLFTALLLSHEKAETLIRHPMIRGVSLTGSDRAGRAVGGEAGQSLKKTVLELGGSDPFIVLADADLSAAAKSATKARTLNTGQSCIAAKRFIVEKSVLPQFTEAFFEEMRQLNQGDPLESTTEIGPLARGDLRVTLHKQVSVSVEKGATRLLGGELPEGKGYFYPPTILNKVKPGMPAFEQETFGPVAALIEADDAVHAVELANQTRFGLGASLWTKDLSWAESLAPAIQAGSVFVNAIVKSDPRLPFGGVKESGYGRELSEEGIREFVNVKTIHVEA